jgi:hypothetical protein
MKTIADIPSCGATKIDITSWQKYNKKEWLSDMRKALDDIEKTDGIFYYESIKKYVEYPCIDQSCHECEHALY